MSAPAAPEGRAFHPFRATMSSTSMSERLDGDMRVVTIRPAGAGDLPAAREVIAGVGLFLGGLEEQFGAQYALAVTRDDVVVGVAGMEVYGAYGLLRSVCVQEPWRGRGIASRLARHRIAWARARSLRAVYLFTKDAAEFWTGVGFTPVALDAWPEPVQASAQWRSGHGRGLTGMVLPLE